MSCAASTVRSVTDFGCFTQASITLKSFVPHQKRALRSVNLLHITCNCNSSHCRKVRAYQAAILEKSERCYLTIPRPRRCPWHPTRREICCSSESREERYDQHQRGCRAIPSARSSAR